MRRDPDAGAGEAARRHAVPMTADPGSSWRRRTKLVCTLGPATQDRIAELVEAGMDVARLNFSHGDPSFFATSAARVRDVARTASRPVGLLADLSGPKIRLGELQGGSLTLEPGAPFALHPGDGPSVGDTTGAR